MRTRTLSTILSTLFFLGLSTQSIKAQEFVSLVGLKASHNTIAISGKIALSEYNYVEGGFGFLVDEPVALGPSAAYHRHFMLSENKKTQFYLGPNFKAAIGDANSLGLGLDLGITYLYKKINIGLEANPTYFFNDVFGFQPIYGIHLRWVNY